MPLARTTPISRTNRGDSPQRLGDGAPYGPMLRHISVAIGYQLDDGQTLAADNVTNLAPEGVPISGSGVRCPEEAGRHGYLETGRGPEQRFKGRRVEQFGLRKKREDPAPVVVEYDDSGIQTELRCGKQAIEIVPEGEVADDENDRAIAGGGDPERGRDHAVNSIRSAVAHNPQPSPVAADERVDVANRHAVADHERRPLGQERRDFRDGAAFEEIIFTRQGGCDRRTGRSIRGLPIFNPPEICRPSEVGNAPGQLRKRGGWVPNQGARREVGRIPGCAGVDYDVHPI